MKNYRKCIVSFTEYFLKETLFIDAYTSGKTMKKGKGIIYT